MKALSRSICFCAALVMLASKANAIDSVLIESSGDDCLTSVLADLDHVRIEEPKTKDDFITMITATTHAADRLDLIGLVEPSTQKAIDLLLKSKELRIETVKLSHRLYASPQLISRDQAIRFVTAARTQYFTTIDILIPKLRTIGRSRQAAILDKELRTAWPTFKRDREPSRVPPAFQMLQNTKARFSYPVAATYTNRSSNRAPGTTGDFYPSRLHINGVQVYGF